MDSSLRAVVRAPFPEHAWPKVWDWIQPCRGSVMDDNSPTSKGEFVDEQLRMCELPTYRTWGVHRDDELGGLITFQTAHPDDTTGWAHTMFKRSFFGRETTFIALHEVFSALFEEGVQVIRSEVFQSNSNVRHLCRRLGFREYGPFPNSCRRDGELIDVVGLFLTSDRLNADWTYSSSGGSGRKHRERIPSGPRPQADSESEDRADSRAVSAEQGSEHPTPGQPRPRSARAAPTRSPSATRAGRGES